MARVIVDTSVWSLGLRRRHKDLSPAQRRLDFLLHDLIVAGDILLLGAIRQELLTGIPSAEQFNRLADRLRYFDEISPEIDDYERAARYSNICLRHGIAPSPIDMLLCAVAAGRSLPILTTDDDFTRYAQHLPIELLDKPA